jgi:hypothetical protein
MEAIKKTATNPLRILLTGPKQSDYPLKPGMKILFITVVLVLGIFIVFQIYTTMATEKTESQPYKVIRVEKDFEIRYYPAATLAMVTSKVKSYKDLGRSGFGKLAGFIFGGNSEKKQIAMTSPVHMTVGDTLSTMAFVLPSGYKPDNLPRPNNGEIAIKTSEPEYVAAIQFGGFASDERIEAHKILLTSALRDLGIAHSGNFRFLGYNPPFQLFGRRNEVIVSLKEDQVNRLKK